MGTFTNGKDFSNDLWVEVPGPDRPHLTIVDFPGLLHSETTKQEVYFGLGGHVLKNMDTEEGPFSLAVLDKKEVEFLSEDVCEDLPRSHVGIDPLRERLSKLLLGKIAAELPSLMEEIQANMDKRAQRLEGIRRSSRYP
ncbi:hypothetical protein BBP40_010904 [Aspergillus hancockii]|nr:hypothetical protein BBP40_010904 [Aspergillus hancockii]